MKAIIFIISSLAQLYLLVLLLRFWLPWVRADFRNPVAQGILKLTSPLIIPLRRVIPSIGRLDTATILVAFSIQFLTICLILFLRGYFSTLPDIAAPTVLSAMPDIAATAIIDLALLSMRLFMFAILIFVILSWVAPGTYNPATAMISFLVRPILDPFSQMLPKPGGIDISPIIAIILLQATMLLVQDYRPFPI